MTYLRVDLNKTITFDRTIMLDTLYIKNYRNLKEIRINSLGRVNLFTGKNNTGKSTILEAIAIYASKGDFNIINQILRERGESFTRIESNKDTLESNIKALASLFINRNVSFKKDDIISIGTIENTLFGDEVIASKSVSLRFVKYFEEMQKDDNGDVIRRRVVLESEIDRQLANYQIGIQIKYGDNSFTLPLDEDRPFRFGYRGFSGKDSFQFIRTRNIDRESNGKLWDNITLTEKEKYVIDALKIIEPSTERIAFIEENPRERTAVIKISDNSGVLPLRSMGDGINRVLTIILALVNSDNGFLLLDEFENGLHHTVQEQLWNIIFKLSQILNVQIFSTTHSEDCISSFENALNSPGNLLIGKLIRLDNQNGAIKQVEFSANELKIANDQNIEIR
jgi:AAA15 family ATPase/GTPase